MIRLYPDSIADANLEPQTIQTHARAFVHEAALFAGEGREVAMCETFDNATMLDEAFADSERDHVLASYRPAKHSVTPEMADKILGHLHLPPRTDAGAGLDGSSPSIGSIGSIGSIEPDPFPEPTKVLLQFIDLCQNGKIPPETFPLCTPVREFVEKLTTGSLS